MTLASVNFESDTSHKFPGVEPRICLVSTLSEQAHTLKNTLENNGFIADVFQQVDAALAAILNHQFDLVIADYHCAGSAMDGAELVKSIRHCRLPKIEQIPVIICVGDLDPSVLEKLKVARASGVLAQPIDPVRLVSMAREMLLRRGYQLSPANQTASASPSPAPSPAPAPGRPERRVANQQDTASAAHVLKQLRKKQAPTAEPTASRLPPTPTPEQLSTQLPPLSEHISDAMELPSKSTRRRQKKKSGGFFSRLFDIKTFDLVDDLADDDNYADDAWPFGEGGGRSQGSPAPQTPYRNMQQAGPASSQVDPLQQRSIGEPLTKINEDAAVPTGRKTKQQIASDLREKVKRAQSAIRRQAAQTDGQRPATQKQFTPRPPPIRQTPPAQAQAQVHSRANIPDSRTTTGKPPPPPQFQTDSRLHMPDSATVNKPVQPPPRPRFRTDSRINKPGSGSTLGPRPVPSPSVAQTDRRKTIPDSKAVPNRVPPVPPTHELRQGEVPDSRPIIRQVSRSTGGQSPPPRPHVTHAGSPHEFNRRNAPAVSDPLSHFEQPPAGGGSILDEAMQDADTAYSSDAKAEDEANYLGLSTRTLWAVSILSIAIGVVFFLGFDTIRNHAEPFMVSKLASFGQNTFWISMAADSGSLDSSTGIDSKDIVNLHDTCKLCKSVTPIVFGPHRRVQAQFSSQSDVVYMDGVNEEYFSLNNDSITAGRVFTADDMRQGTPMAVIGPQVKNALFGPGGADPVGKVIRVGKLKLAVIGVLKEKDASLLLSLGSAKGYDINNRILIPYTFYQQRLGTDAINMLQVSTEKIEYIDKTIAQVVQILRKRHDRTGFETQSTQDWLNLTQAYGKGLSIIGVSVAAVCFVLGGMAIMSIVGLSVVNRAKSRKMQSKGPLPGSVLTIQVVMDAMVISAIGGLTGVAIGILLNYGISFWAKVTIDIAWSMAIFGLAIAMFVGLISALHTAMRAGRLASSV